MRATVEVFVTAKTLEEALDSARQKLDAFFGMRPYRVEEARAEPYPAGPDVFGVVVSASESAVA